MHEPLLRHPGEETSKGRELFLNRPCFHLLEPLAHVVPQASLGTESIGRLEVRNEMRSRVELPCAQRLRRDLRPDRREPTPDELW